MTAEMVIVLREDLGRVGLQVGGVVYHLHFHEVYYLEGLLLIGKVNHVSGIQKVVE